MDYVKKFYVILLVDILFGGASALAMQQGKSNGAEIDDYIVIPFTSHMVDAHRRFHERAAIAQMYQALYPDKSFNTLTMDEQKQFSELYKTTQQKVLNDLGKDLEKRRK